MKLAHVGEVLFRRGFGVRVSSHGRTLSVGAYDAASTNEALIDTSLLRGSRLTMDATPEGRVTIEELP